MKTRLVLTITIAAVFTVFIGSCSSLKFSYPDNEHLTTFAAPTFPETQFAVISDPHVYDTSLGTSGPDFEEYLANDRKMLALSRDILQEAAGMVAEENPDFIIITGDLTKDGELHNHELLASLLMEFSKGTGIPVYVVPGNHDILNPHSVRFTREGHEAIPSITPEQFAGIYENYGYGGSLFRDPASLSYVAEPVEGLWLLALDSCDYTENPGKEEPETNGRFTRETVSWIENVLSTALENGKGVIAFMHHGILEHYDSQEKHYGEYIVDEYEKISRMLAEYRVRTVFTGHYHAQDITLKEWEPGKFIYDIETGSLITYPSPVRFVTIDSNQKMHIESRFVEDLPGFSGAEETFVEYARNYVHQGISGIAITTMEGLKVKPEAARRLAPGIADAFVAHYQGDEVFPGGEMLPTRGIGFMGKLVVANRRSLIEGLWQDLPPADNEIVIDLTTGEWE